MSTWTTRPHTLSYAAPPRARFEPAKALPPASRKDPGALVINDDADFQYILKHMLAAIGFAVTVTDTAAEAGRLAARARPALIVTDLRANLHDTNLIPAELRRIPSLAHVPMIVCSAWPFPDDGAVARSLGADLFMTVPVDFRAICTLARRVISDLHHRRATGTSR